MSRCYVASTCSVLGIDWAGHSQDGLTHCLGFLLNFTDWLVWSMFLPHHFSSCGSIIYFNIWEVMFASLFHIRLRKTVSIFFPEESHHHFIWSLIKLVHDHFPLCLPIQACSESHYLEPGWRIMDSLSWKRHLGALAMGCWRSHGLHLYLSCRCISN